MIVKTQCARDCPDACFMDAYVHEGRLIQVMGGKDNPVTAGFLCPRGIGDPKRVYSQDRVFYPRVRDSKRGIWKRATWTEALDRISGKLMQVIEERSPKGVLLLDYSGNTGLLTSQFSTRLWNLLGVTRTDHTICSSSGHEALRLHYGLSYGLDPEELLNMGLITFWGHNCKVSSPHSWGLALKAKQSGGKIVSIDPRKSETSVLADLWLNPKPGSDVALAYGIARNIIERGGADTDFIYGWTTGFDDYKEEVFRWTPSRVESTTGIEWAKIEKYTDLLLEKSPRAFIMGIGFQKSRYGAESVRAVSLLPALLGEHRGFYYTNSRGTFIDYAYLSGGNKFKGKIVSQVAIGERLEAGEFGFVWVQGMNPALTLPGLNSVRNGLNRDDAYVAVFDTHLTETCDYADMILPAATFFEKDDVIISDSHRYTRFSRKAIDPLGESRSEVEVMRDLAEKIGQKNVLLSEDPLEALRVTLKGAFENGDLDDLLSGKVLRVSRRKREEYQTPSNKIELCSSASGVEPLPIQLPIEEEGGFFTLLNSAQPNWTHSQFRDVYGIIPLECTINPRDAEALGINHGEDIELYNQYGQIRLKSRVSDDVSERVLWSPRPLKDSFGRAQNSLAPSSRQRIGGGPFYNSIRVKIRKVN